MKVRLLVSVLGFLGSLLPLSTGGAAAPALLVEGQRAPAFTYRLLDHRALRSAELRGHPYVLWMVATWCSSCQTGSAVVGSHIALFRQHGVRIVEMELANNLGAAGPGLDQLRKAVGKAGASSNWYWGELTQDQTLALDPKAEMDKYYLVDANGRIAVISGNPAATWDTIARFIEATPKLASMR